jgi:hypothetical protein
MRHGDAAAFRPTRHQCEARRRSWRGVQEVVPAEDPRVLPGGRAGRWCMTRLQPSIAAWLGLLGGAQKCIVQRRPFHPEGPTNRCFACARVQGGQDRGEFFLADGLGPSAPFPPALRGCQPALMRSCVKARSYWASAPNTLNRKAPCGVVVSICSVNKRKATPWACRVVTICKRWGSDRPSRSSFHTIKQSPGWT